MEVLGLFGKLMKSSRKAKSLSKKGSKPNKRQAKKEQKKKKANKKDAPVKVNEKERVPGDVRLFRWFPRLFAIGLVCLTVGFGWIVWNNHEIKVSESQASMPNGTALPLFRGDSKGKLALQNTVLSKDGRTLAASIVYDDDAHQNLSAFGKKYGLWLLAPNGYPVKGIHLKYGFFGTDGNGVLQITSDRPLKDKAFIVILADKSQLVSADQLSATSNVSDVDIDQSITAQLSTGTTNATSSSSNDDAKIGQMAMYYVRLNPANAKRLDFNWDNNERTLVESLFVKHNLNKIRKAVAQNNKKLKLAKKTLAEYNARLKENPQDQNALDGKQSIEQSIEQLKDSNAQQNKRLDKLESVKISRNVLGDQQTKHKTLVTDKVDLFGNNGYGG